MDAAADGVRQVLVVEAGQGAKRAGPVAGLPLTGAVGLVDGSDLPAARGKPFGHLGGGNAGADYHSPSERGRVGDGGIRPVAREHLAFAVNAEAALRHEDTKCKGPPSCRG